MHRRWGVRPLAGALVATAIVVAPIASLPAGSDDAAHQWTVPAVWAEPIDGGTVVAAGREHLGSVEVRPHLGALATVAHLQLEDYVAGLAEVPNRWPDAALEAQAIAARSYALSEIGRTVVTSWSGVADICSTEACQVYAGLEKERAPHGTRWRAAVERTAGHVLLWDGRPIRAKYSSSNGGWSVSGGLPYLPSVEDPHDSYSPNHQWLSSIPVDQVAAALSLGWSPTHASKGGSVIALYHVDEATGAVTEHQVELHAFRTAMNVGVPTPAGVPRPVPSTRFEAKVEDGFLVLAGVGFGHGIGMSQWGAYGKAVHGWSAPQILAAYYGGLTPVRWEAAPDTIRVALAVGDASTTIDGGPFRLVAGDGTVLASRAAGPWSITEAPGGVTITGQRGSAAELPASVGPAEAAALLDREPIQPPPPPPLSVPAVAAAPPARPPLEVELGVAEVLAAFMLVAITLASVQLVRHRPLPGVASLQRRRRR